jgi:hypothetical protein
MTKKRDDAEAPLAPRRKPYRTPRFERLGTLTDITAQVGFKGSKNDHGPNPMKKTS